MLSRTVCCILLGTAAVSVTTAQSESTEDFATVKAHHIARLQQELSCVEAATSFNALRACRPAPPQGHGGPPPESKD